MKRITKEEKRRIAQKADEKAHPRRKGSGSNSVAHIAFSTRSDCWNKYDSYGMICVHCGCCSPDKKERLTARLDLSLRQLEWERNFSEWADDPDLIELQKKNMKLNQIYWGRRARYYKAELQKMKDDAREAQRDADNERVIGWKRSFYE